MKKIWGLIILSVLAINSVVFAESLYTDYIPDKNVILYSKDSRVINNIDPNINTVKRNNNFPGYRGTNQLIIYTKEYGCRTNTNEFGAEAIVKGNTVVAISGADSLIPEDGVVISGHGSAKTWINKNIIVGSRVFIDSDKKTITVYTTSDSYLFAAKAYLKEVEEIMKFYPQEDIAYNLKKINESIKSAKNSIKKAESHPNQVQEYSQLAIDYANKALSLSIPYKSGEFRGVWLRPNCKNKNDVIYIVNRLANAGINNIFIETYYHGMTIFPSKTMAKYGLVKQNPIFEDFDALKCFIEECHKKNIKVHIWFETFYVGNKHPDSNKNSILSVYPDWSNHNKKNCTNSKPTSCSAEHNGYFLDPANPEVQTFLAQLICEIVYSYNPDGFNIDYIRYPQSNPPRYNASDDMVWGYTNCARTEFKSVYGVDPFDITPGDDYWQSWCDYRRDKVTSFLRRVSKICRSNHIMLTAVIFPNRILALENKQQDWAIWTANDYVDGFTPLFLTCDAATASDLIKGVLRYKNSKTKLYAGIFTAFMNGSQADLIRQIHETRKLKLNGFSIFDYAHFNDNYITTLKASICSPPQGNKRKIKVKNNKKRG